MDPSIKVRELKNGGLEIYARARGVSLRIITDAEDRQIAVHLLQELEEATGESLPAAKFLPKRGKRRGPRPMAGQVDIDGHIHD